MSLELARDVSGQTSISRFSSDAKQEESLNFCATPYHFLFQLQALTLLNYFSYLFKQKHCEKSAEEQHKQSRRLKELGFTCIVLHHVVCRLG